MRAVAYELSDMWVLAVRSAKRIPRQPDLLIGFTAQPLMFVLLSVYVFGGAISTPGFSYVDFLIPGIIVQTMAFGGFVTALGLSEELKKGLMDRFRSLPMSRSAVLTGRTLADVSTNVVQFVVVLGVGLLVGFDFKTGFGDIVAGIALLLGIGYSFSWRFAFVGLTASSPEAANAYGFTILGSVSGPWHSPEPVSLYSSAFEEVTWRPGDDDPGGYPHPERRESPSRSSLARGHAGVRATRKEGDPIYPQFVQLQTRLALVLEALDRRDACAERSPAKPRATGIFARLGFRRR